MNTQTATGIERNPLLRFMVACQSGVAFLGRRLRRESLMVLVICCAGTIDVRGAGGSAAVGEVDSLNQKVGELYRQGKYSEALPLAERALAIREKELGPDHQQTASSIFNLAAQYVGLGNYAKAEPLFLRALAIEEKALSRLPRC